MNERIRQLAEQAGFLTENGNFYADSFDAINDEVEAFAELIIQECIEVSDLALTEEYDRFLPSEMIAKHFNLELEE
jgi:hypothetical protein